MPSRSSSRRSTRAAAPEAEAEAHTESGAALTEIVLEIFRLNGALLEIADTLSGPAGLTASRWQVLAAIADGPRTVAEVSRQMGLTRQGVQRLANILADEGFAEYAANPAHRRAKLLRLTRLGADALRIVGRRQRAWANEASASIPATTLKACARALARVIEQVEGGSLRPRGEIP
jgi:DNA-binding MarR family transcriptional regulator